LSKLPSAHYIEYQAGECRTHCYWRPQFKEDPAGRKLEQASGELLDVLRTSLRNSVPREGKIGAFLSGGLDSSTVTGVMAELERKDAEAYSIGFAAEGYDEMAFARITAKHFGVKLNEYYVTAKDVVDALPLIATSYDEPFGNSSALPAYFCARMAADNGVDTLLAGDGGDEIFAGNERYIKQNVFERYQLIPGAIRRGLIEPLVKMLPAAVPLASKAGSYLEQANTPLPQRLQSYNFLHRHAASEIFSDDFLAEVDTQQPIELQRDIYQRPDEGSDLNRMLYLDWQNTLADNDLRKVSHMCALAGVDVVYPMLDDHLVDFSCGLPSNWKIKNANLRHFYKHSLQNWLPDATINKSKQGFGLPFGVWMRTYKPLREMAYDNLLKLKQRGLIRPEFIDRTIAMHQSEHAAYYGELVWIFNVFELWISGRPQHQSTSI
ncbi:MAG: asparagine synthase (glutamine-hydrolyzing), partial [Bacteroidia bacterium]